MKVIWNISDKREECPRCDSVLITFDGRRNLCPSCAAREIERLRQQVARLTKRAADSALPKGTKGGVEVTIVDGVVRSARAILPSR